MNSGLLADALNFLDDQANVSEFIVSEAELWAGFLTAVGGSGSASTMSITDMMDEIVNQLSDEPDVSDKSVRYVELLAAIVNALDDSADVTHLTSTVHALYVALVDAAEVYGGEELEEAPEGFAYIVNADGEFLVNADDAFILAKV